MTLGGCGQRIDTRQAMRPMSPTETEHTYPRFSDGEMKRRFENVRAAMQQVDLDCLLVAGSSSRWNEKNANIRYLAEFADKENMCSYLVVPLEGEPTLFNWASVRVNNIRLMSSITDVRPVHPYYAEGVVDRIKELGLTKGTIGIDSYDRFMGIPHNHYETITRELSRATIKLVSGLVEAQRLLKSPEEVAFIRKACELVDKAVTRMVETTRPGMTDYQVYANVEHEIMVNGGEAPLLTLVASTSMENPDLPFPNIIPSGKKIQEGDVILTEFTGRYAGYWGQTHKPLALGKPTALFQKLFDVNLDMYKFIVEQLYPGNSYKNVLGAQRFLDEAGLIKIAPFLHGIGMEAPEEPVIGLDKWPFDENDEIKEGMTFIVEPNPVTVDKKAAMFLGDTFVVTKDGCECLNTFPPVFSAA